MGNDNRAAEKTVAYEAKNANLKEEIKAVIIENDGLKAKITELKRR